MLEALSWRQVLAGMVCTLCTWFNKFTLVTEWSSHKWTGTGSGTSVFEPGRNKPNQYYLSK